MKKVFCYFEISMVDSEDGNDSKAPKAYDCDQIERALVFMRMNFSDKLSVAEIASHIRRSVPWTKALFKAMTGKGVWAHLLQMRIEKAKELLWNTRISISNIALQTGFNSHNTFTVAFRRATGVSPTRFRVACSDSKKQPSSRRPVRKTDEVLFRHRMGGPQLGPWWKTISGEWRGGADCVVGRGADLIALTYTGPLPENCQIDFEFRFERVRNGHLFASLHGGDLNHPYCWFSIGAHQNAVGSAAHLNLPGNWNAKAVLHPGQWQAASLLIQDNVVRFGLDRIELFVLRDPFLPPYSLRNCFSFGSWQDAVSLRNFQMQDLGFSPLVQEIRQGDSLYAAGSYDVALDFFQRRHRSSLANSDALELEYKIGMCLLRLGDYARARTWLDKAEVLGEKNLWSQHARTALVELEYLVNDFDAALIRMRSLSPIPEFAPALQELAPKIRASYLDRGFYQRGLEVIQQGLPTAKVNSIPYFALMEGTADSLRYLNRFPQALEFFRGTADSSVAPEQFVLTALQQIADIRANLGEFTESDRVLAQIKNRADNHETLALSVIYHAFNVRAQGRIEEAVTILSGIPALYPRAGRQVTFALRHLCYLRCCLGQLQKARDAANEAWKGIQEGLPSRRSLDYYILDLLEGRTSSGAEHLQDDAFGQSAGPIEAKGRQALIAGILLELNDERLKARAVWEHAIERFPPTECCFIEKAAQAFVSGNIAVLREMPYPNSVRSELFYLAGLIVGRRGHPDSARQFFAAAIEEDLTLRWPAYLARQELLIANKS